jgi:hypothetical protein
MNRAILHQSIGISSIQNDEHPGVDATHFRESTQGLEQLRLFSIGFCAGGRLRSCCIVDFIRTVGLRYYPSESA